MIVVIGDTIVDRYIHCTDMGENPDYASVPMVNTGEEVSQVGGATNVAENIVALGGDCTYIGYVTKELKEQLTCKVSRQKNLVVDKLYTITRYVNQHDQHLLRIDPQYKYKPLDKLPAILKKATVVVLSDYTIGTFYSSIVDKIRQLTKAPIIIDSRDPRGWHGLRDITIRANATEWKKLGFGFKESNKDSVTFVVTDGPGDVKILQPEQSTVKKKVPKKKVVDTIGAGDTFTAAYAVTIAEGGTPTEGAVYAIQAATFSVTKPGTYKVTKENISGKLGSRRPTQQPNKKDKADRQGKKNADEPPNTSLTTNSTANTSKTSSKGGNKQNESRVDKSNSKKRVGTRSVARKQRAVLSKVSSDVSKEPTNTSTPTPCKG